MDRIKIEVGKKYRGKSTGNLCHITKMVKMGNRFEYWTESGTLFASFQDGTPHELRADTWEEVQETPSPIQKEMDQTFLINILMCYKDSNIIGMIKLVREKYGYGLKEAKDYVDHVMAKAGKNNARNTMRQLIKENERLFDRDFDVMAVEGNVYVIKLL